MSSNVSFDIASSELHNVVVIDGETRTRRGLRLVGSVTTDRVFVGSFSVESPFSSEVWHYLFEQVSLSLEVFVRVVTEEQGLLFSMSLGVCPADPVVTYAVVNNQLMVNSPSFPCPYYGLIGGGLIPAVKTESDNPETGALDLPPGGCCAWGGRVVIWTANQLLVNAFNAGSPDIRTFIAPNVIPFPGTIYDAFVGPDGALYVFTSADAYVVPVDVISQAQIAQGFIATIPGVCTSAPRNACASSGSVLALSEDGLLFVTLANQERVDLAPYEGKRFFTPAVEVDDYRRGCAMLPTATGVVIGFGSRGYWLDVDLRNGYRSYTWFTGQPTRASLAGTLRSRDGATLYVTRSEIFMLAGNVDEGDVLVTGVACGRIDIPADASLTARFITVATDAVGADTLAYMGGVSSTLAAPTIGVDTVIGTALWGASTSLYGRDKRTVAHGITTRTADVQAELGVRAGDRRVYFGDIEVRGQGRQRRTRG